jgi:CMP-N-acetylneuraminic acid synthetase
MYQNKKVLAVVPARGGSKGIPLKNIHPLGGKPLLCWTMDVLSRLPEFDRVYVSTDSDQVACVAADCGYKPPFLRPDSLSGDRIGDWDVLYHALTRLEALDACTYDVIVMLQPTCPFRSDSHVRDCLRKLIHEDLDSVWSLSMTDSKAHPLKQLTLQDNRMDYYDSLGGQIIARQQLEPLYHRNGAAYAISRTCLLDQHSIKGARSSAVVIEDPLVNIDTPDDLEYAEYLLEKGKVVV